MLQKESYEKLDFDYCKIFIEHIINYYVGEDVLLNNGQICKVMQVDVNDFERPLIMSENGFIDLKQRRDLYIEKLVI